MKCLVDVKYDGCYDELVRNTFIIQAKDLIDLKEKLKELVKSDSWYKDSYICCYDLSEISNSVNNAFMDIEDVHCIFEVDIKYNREKLFDK